MMASSAWVYVELLAPDFRFAMLMFLLSVGAVFWVGWHGRRRAAVRNACSGLVVFFLLSFCAWLVTTGNGRYFMSGMVLVGVLLVAAIYHLPVRFDWKFLFLFLAFGLQFLAVSQNSPWRRFDSYEWVEWRDHSYFRIEGGDLRRYDGAVMVTLQPQSFAAMAPLFPSGVRWINTSVFEGSDLRQASSRFGRADEIFKKARNIYLIQRTQPSESDALGRPSGRAAKELNVALRYYGLSLRGLEECEFLRSETMARMTLLSSTKAAGESEALMQKAGFWVCAVNYDGVLGSALPETAEAESVTKMFADLEAACPRLFPPGQVGLRPHSAGLARIYAVSDSVVIFERGSQTLYVKYQRALNPQRIGRDYELKKMKQAGCSLKLNGRGSPWSWLD
ncbi:hypothetical protein [Aquabacterium sp.]|uniref:hypothetical protein n=1 Tax=Aquabacterium sp. TaxID=1872578 RepID=UPI0025B9058B|nr:hypothetical protein [Aquabacterium sp.]